MTRTLAPPALYRRRPGESKVDARERFTLASYRWADANRIAVVCGVMLVGSFPPATPLDDVITALADVKAFAELPYPVRTWRPWRWDPDHEDLTLWHAGRMLALVSRGASGELFVRRFDRP